MRKAKRLLSLLLALMMALALVACAGNGENTPTSESGKNTNTASVSDTTNTGSGSDKVTANTSFQPPLPRPAEMEGKTFTILQHHEDDFPFGYGQDQRYGEMALARLQEVEELYGCTLEFTQVAYSDEFNAAIQQRALAGDPGDLIYSINNAQLRRTLGTGGDESLMVDLLTVDHIINFWDMNKWGNITARECMMAGGTFYGVTPALWYNATPLPMYIIVYNKEMLTRFGATDPQEYWEQGEWNRETMLEVITSCLDSSGSNPVWGMTATLDHMVRMTFLTTGKNLAILDEDDPTVWSRGLDTPEAAEALGWLQQTLKAYKPYFNNGSETWATWGSHGPFLQEQSAMCLTGPAIIFDRIVTGMDDFGLMCWGASENNFLSGYYENVYAISIPTFAQNAEWSAYLMYDLFEGLGDIETVDDMIAYYRENYFDSDIDIEILMRSNASLQYSYWPNDGMDGIYSQLAGGLMNASSMTTLISRYAAMNDSKIEKHIVPNQIALHQYKLDGKY